MIYERVAAEVANGFFALAWSGSEAAGTVKFQLTDPEFWPDRPDDNAAYIHRLGVRRRFAGGGVSTALMTWAVNRARAKGPARTGISPKYPNYRFRPAADSSRLSSLMPPGRPDSVGE